MTPKQARYEALLPEIKALIDPDCGQIANFANVSAALYAALKPWWCGFYIVNQNRQLELGPFQGPVACTLIGFNKGVCGTAWATRKTVVVPDVHAFEGHIACSSESNSEIVVPLIRNGEVTAVLDIDSTEFNAFDETERQYLEAILDLL